MRQVFSLEEWGGGGVNKSKNPPVKTHSLTVTHAQRNACSGLLEPSAWNDFTDGFLSGVCFLLSAPAGNRAGQTLPSTSAAHAFNSASLFLHFNSVSRSRLMLILEKKKKKSQ